MPASEETYYRQPTMHIVFAITSVAMALVTVWMIMADHLRPWKQTQRTFQRIETAKLQSNEAEQLKLLQAKSADRLQEIDRRRAAASQRAADNARRIRDQEARIRSATGTFQKLDTAKRFKKAELDSQRSFYDGMIDRDERAEAQRYRVSTIQPSERELAELSRQYEDAERALARATFDKGLLGSIAVEVSKPPPPGTPADEAGLREGDSIEVKDFEAARSAAEDALAKGEPARVALTVTGKDGKSRQLELNVPRRDPTLVRADAEPRYTGRRGAGAAAAEAPTVKVEPPTIESLGLLTTPITLEVLDKRKEDLTRDKDRVARSLEQKQAQYGMGSGFWGVKSRLQAFVRGLPILDYMAPPTKIQQISLPDLLINYNFKEVPRYDRCTTCHQAIDRPGYGPTYTDVQGKVHPIPAVFRSHPHLTDGATTTDPRGNVTQAGLYLDSNGPHKINDFGCTICHGGQGSGTTFTFASHEPNDLKEKARWESEHDWREIHHWDEPMLPTRFQEAACLKCHYQVTDVPQAAKLQAGYQRITKYGCTGCHTIGGEGAIGPDLTDNRQVGPNLKHIGYKLSKDWTLKWIKNPHAFRPDTRMPRFFGITNNDHPADWPKNHAEIHAIAHYLFNEKVTSPPPGFDDPPKKSDADHGKDLFLQKGCLACHSNRPYTAADLPRALGDELSETYKVDVAKTTDPSQFPESVRAYAQANFGPNLSSMAAKFESYEKGYRWLANWIKDPEAYHPKSLMPNLQLSAQDAADIAAWILSARSDWKADSDAFWPVKVEVPAVDSREVKEGLDELVALYLSKSKVYNKRTILLSEVDSTVAEMSADEKMMYVGEKTISRLGCFGCHNIKGFESAKPIGTALNGWGFKSPTKLDFGHITEYLNDNAKQEGDEFVFDGTDEYYKEKLDEHTRSGFLYQKLHRPRSYDYRKDRADLKSWDDRLRMPQFAWADDPKAIEEVMTFVLGLTGEKIPGQYLPDYTPAKAAVAQGERLLERYNCRGCHVLKMPTYTIVSGTKVQEAMPDLATNVEVSYADRENDYLGFYKGLKFDPKNPPKLDKDDGQAAITIEAMPTDLIEDEDDQGRPIKKLSVQLWRPATILGYTFNVGDKVVLNPSKVETTPAEGGNFAWLFATSEKAKTGSDFATFWNRLPPPLLREGTKVQSPWLMGFLKDPYSIRPAAQLRMPRFHYGATEEEVREVQGAMASVGLKEGRETLRGETRDLANYFAARDGAVFPYQDIPQREQAYLAERGSEHDHYLGDGWQIITKGLCVQCHAIGQFKPTGGADVVNGPDLRQVADRFRPGYLYEWLARPTRLVPYTAMPQNIPPKLPEGSPTPAYVPKGFEGHPLMQVRAMRDTLLNYSTAVEQQLANDAKPTEPEAPKDDKKKVAGP